MLLSSLRFCGKCALLWPVQQWRPLSRHLQCCVLQKLSAAWRLMPSSICLILCQWFWSRCKLQIQFSKWWLFNLCTFLGRTRKCYRCLGRLPVKLLLCRQCHASRSFLKNLLMLLLIFRNDVLMLSCITSLHKVVDTLPNFLSPYLLDLLIQVCERHFVSNMTRLSITKDDDVRKSNVYILLLRVIWLLPFFLSCRSVIFQVW